MKTATTTKPKRPTEGEAADALAELAQASETHLHSFTEAIAGPLRVLQEDSEEWSVRRRALELVRDLRELLAVAKDHATDRLAHAQDVGERPF